jgi:Mg2+ and Co2+ transporter CorA
MTERRITVREAASRLGISERAVRGRVKRGTLRGARGEGGKVYVLWEGDQTDRTVTPIEELRDRISLLEDQLDAEREANKENRRAIAAMRERIVEMESHPHPRPTSDDLAEAESRTGVPLSGQEAAQRSWWANRLLVASFVLLWVIVACVVFLLVYLGDL